MISSGGQFFLSSAKTKRESASCAWTSRYPFTLEPASYVVKCGCVRDIVQQKSGIRSSIIHWCLGFKSVQHFNLGQNNDTYHATKPLLAGSIPQLQPDLQTINIHLLRNKKSPGRRCRVLGIK